jgi:hypothetical protein
VADLKLPTVTLAAVTSVNVSATVFALSESMKQAEVAQTLLLTDIKDAEVPPGIRVQAIEPLRSMDDYCRFMLTRLADYIETSHVLICQWDGFVVDASAWSDEFLDVDYIGARWPQFRDGHEVGNGGFSLRSKRLLDALRQPEIVISSPEDVAIGRLNRDRLEQDYGIRFADQALADRFSFERTMPQGRTFGFHGAFNMVPFVGAERFWSIYRSLDRPESVWRDARLIARQLRGTPGAARRRIQLAADRWLG